MGQRCNQCWPKTPTNNSSQLLLLSLISSGRPKQQRAVRMTKLKVDALFKMSAKQLRRWGVVRVTENASKSDSQSGLSRMESVCAGEGFYQRLTLTGIPVWDCPSNSCVPQEAVHKKQPKTPEDISYVASRLTGSTKTESHGFLFHSGSSTHL